jgi:hypothetical protein
MKHTLRASICAFLLPLAAASAPVRAQVDAGSDVALKAQFLFNLARFTEWPSIGPTASITLCVVGDARIAKTLIETVRGQRIGAHQVGVEALGSSGPMPPCHMLFVAGSEAKRAAALLDRVKRQPVLTVSDDKDFARSSGIVEFFDENGRVRFAINTDGAERAGLKLSSRLLGLARIVHDDHAQ